jgi:hypothetical protein
MKMQILTKTSKFSTISCTKTKSLTITNITLFYKSSLFRQKMNSPTIHAEKKTYFPILKASVICTAPQIRSFWLFFSLYMDQTSICNIWLSARTWYNNVQRRKQLTEDERVSISVEFLMSVSCGLPRLRSLSWESCTDAGILGADISYSNNSLDRYSANVHTQFYRWFSTDEIQKYHTLNAGAHQQHSKGNNQWFIILSKNYNRNW